VVPSSDRPLAWAPALGFGTLNLASAGVIAVGVFAGLPDRYWPVDTVAFVLVALLAASGIGLVLRASWSPPCAKVAAAASLAVGLLLVGTLAVTASYLAGIYGPIGRGGSILFLLVLALAIPYLVAIPLAELVWLNRRATPKSTSAHATDPR
jgi:hypothetical protein